MQSSLDRHIGWIRRVHPFPGLCWRLYKPNSMVAVAPLCGLLPLRFELACRCSRFILKCLNSFNSIVRFVARQGVLHQRMYSPIGRNAQHVWFDFSNMNVYSLVINVSLQTSAEPHLEPMYKLATLYCSSYEISNTKVNRVWLWVTVYIHVET